MIKRENASMKDKIREYQDITFKKDHILFKQSEEIESLKHQIVSLSSEVSIEKFKYDTL